MGRPRSNTPKTSLTLRIEVSLKARLDNIAYHDLAARGLAVDEDVNLSEYVRDEILQTFVTDYETRVGLTADELEKYRISAKIAAAEAEIERLHATIKKITPTGVPSRERVTVPDTGRGHASPGGDEVRDGLLDFGKDAHGAPRPAAARTNGEAPPGV